MGKFRHVVWGIVVLTLIIMVFTTIMMSKRDDRKVYESAMINGYDQVQNVGNYQWHWKKRSGEVTDVILKQRQMKFETEFNRDFEKRYRKDVKALLSGYNTFKKQVNQQLKENKQEKRKK